MTETVAVETPEAEPQPGALHIFRHRDFTLFFTAASVSNGGSWMQLVAVQALLFDLTNSGGWLGLSTVASLVPAVILTPPAGVLADRISRRAILIVMQLMQMAAAFALWGLYAGHVVTPWWIIVIGFVNGIATGIQTSAWQSFVPLLVPGEEMLQAVRLNSVQFTVARAIGPALGGIVVKFWGIGAAIMVNAVTFLLVIGSLVFAHPRVNQTAARAQKAIEGLLDGARYMWRRRPLRLAIILALVASTLGQSLQYVASAISERLFHHPSDGNAGLLTALGVGAVLSSGVAVMYGDRLRRSTMAMVSLALFAVATSLLPLAHAYTIGMALYFVAGLAHLQMAVALNTLIQGAVPDEYRGRAASFALLGTLAGIPLGTQILGSLGDAIGFRPALALDAAAFVIVLLVLLVTGLFRDLDATPAEIAAL